MSYLRRFSLKFGLFYELQLPKPAGQPQWNPEDEHKIYHDMLDQVELADRHRPHAAGLQPSGAGCRAYFRS